eukprot:TRINITY_DN10063_c0_g1_i1.p1 TRINITY_DN10063_c0_g1~~TRINITY_DN10063_c0_g1_i1.p1  ORF type:complete len:212 (+),score=65.39 TRINITY_DN10063_c0_g1_i1:46-636(+)
MGGAASAAGLRMMEIIWPSAGQSVILSNPKMLSKFEKEMNKSNLSADIFEGDEDYIDGDMDTEVSRCIDHIWSVYDKKNTGSLNKKAVQQFFSDLLELYALRTNRKKKDCLGAGVNMKKASEDCFVKMNVSGSQMVTKDEFSQFLLCYDLDEALAPFTGTGDTVNVNLNVSLVDTSVFENQKREGPKLVYRDYPDD